jgi:phenylacetate-CoA ligase
VSILALPVEVARRQKEQWVSPAELATIRLQRLRALLEKARSAPYYRRMLPRGMTGGEELGSLPLLDKKHIVENGEEALLTAGGNDLMPVFTSGSTGHPMRFLRSPWEEAEFSARWYRVYSAYGGKSRDTLLNVGRPNAKPRGGAVKVMRDLGILPKIENTSVTDPVEDQVRVLRGFKPHFVTGYSIGIENIADYIVRHGIDVQSPKAAFCAAMDVTDRCRQLVNRAFNAPAVNVYVSNEFGVVSWECPEQPGSLHVNDDMLVMEIVDGDGRPVPDGTSGEIVLTSLTLTRMPLLRYRTGDTAARIPGPCPCGRGLGLMTPVQGRTSHTIVGAGGRLITTPVVGYALGLAGADEWVRRFQLREQENRKLVLLVELHREPRPRQIESLVAELARIAGPGYKIGVEMRDELPLAPSGKYQYVVPLPGPGRTTGTCRKDELPGIYAGALGTGG